MVIPKRYLQKYHHPIQNFQIGHLNYLNLIVVYYYYYFYFDLLNQNLFLLIHFGDYKNYFRFHQVLHYNQ